jgi:signal transduction histidine kinase
LESTLDWYIPTIERQTGIAISYEKRGVSFPVDSGAGVHVYRVLQEALNNVARHSGAKQAWVRLHFLPDVLELDIEDHGVGFAERTNKRGIGLVAMRERSELMGGQIIVSRPPEGGTLVHLEVPRGKVESYGKEDHSVAGG